MSRYIQITKENIDEELLNRKWIIKYYKTAFGNQVERY